MKIKRLEISGYKNLNVEFEHNGDTIAIIGNNGCGKSNVLEALSYIFSSLYLDTNKVYFDYLLEYENTDKKTIKIEKSKSKSFSQEDFKNFKPLFDLIEKIRNRNNISAAKNETKTLVIDEKNKESSTVKTSTPKKMRKPSFE